MVSDYLWLASPVNKCSALFFREGLASQDLQTSQARMNGGAAIITGYLYVPTGRLDGLCLRMLADSVVR